MSEFIICGKCNTPLPTSFFSDRQLRKPRALPICKYCKSPAVWQNRMRPDEPCDFTGADWYRALNYWGNACAVCRKAGYLHVEHWMPLGTPLGQGHVPTNVLPLCPYCNKAKGSEHPYIYLRERFGELARFKIAEIEAYFDMVRRYPLRAEYARVDD